MTRRLAAAVSIAALLVAAAAGCRHDLAAGGDAGGRDADGAAADGPITNTDSGVDSGSDAASDAAPDAPSGWVRGGTADTVGSSQVEAVAVDDQGYVVVVGHFSGELRLGNTLHQSDGPDRDIFVARYDSNGSLRWSAVAGGAGRDRAYSVTIDKNRQIYISGAVGKGQVTFGEGTFKRTATVVGQENVFAASYKPGGDLVWLMVADGPGKHFCHSAAVAGDRLYLAGAYRKSIDFAGAAGQLSFAGTTEYEMFIAAVDTNNGAPQWAVDDGGGTAMIFPNGLAIDPRNGDLLVAGEFDGRAVLNKGVAAASRTILGTVNGTRQAFLARYDKTGAFRWAREDGGPANDRASGLAVDASGTAWVTGYFGDAPALPGDDKATFGKGESKEITLNGVGTATAYVARYAASGALMWVRAAGGTGKSSGEHVAVAGGFAWVVGFFTDSAIIGGVKLGGLSRNAFLVRYSSGGAASGAVAAYGPGIDFATSVTLTPTDVVLGGYFTDSAQFGTLPLKAKGTHFFVWQRGR